MPINDQYANRVPHYHPAPPPRFAKQNSGAHNLLAQQKLNPVKKFDRYVKTTTPFTRKALAEDDFSTHCRKFCRPGLLCAAQHSYDL